MDCHPEVPEASKASNSHQAIEKIEGKMRKCNNARPDPITNITNWKNPVVLTSINKVRTGLCGI